MAHVRRITRPSGLVRWQARVSVVVDGRRIERARDFASERAAKTWMHGEGRLIEQRGVQGEGTVGAFFTQWLDYLREAGQHQAKTLVEYGQRLGRLRPLIGHIRLDRLSPA